VLEVPHRYTRRPARLRLRLPSLRAKRKQCRAASARRAIVDDVAPNGDLPNDRQDLCKRFANERASRRRYEPASSGFRPGGNPC
jgi:hypothetical protein